MFKQAISSSSRALRSSSRAFAQRPFVLARPQITPAPISALRSQIPSSRWYSEETEPAAKKDGEAAAAPEGKESGKESGKEGDAPLSAEAELKQKLEAKELEVIKWRDQALRSVADFRNLQDRAQRDQKIARDFAISKFAKDLVDSVDNLDRALTMGQEKLKALGEDTKNEDLQAFYEGVKMTEGIMLQTLSKHGLERFSPEGEKFNPNEHEATFMAPMPDKEDGTVFFIQQKGFKLNGRVIRAAKVGVVKNQ